MKLFGFLANAKAAICPSTPAQLHPDNDRLHDLAQQEFPLSVLNPRLADLMDGEPGIPAHLVPEAIRMFAMEAV